jgi:hypothetical protein
MNNQTSPNEFESPNNLLRLDQNIEQQLGYCGQDRFVLFYFDPRSRHVMWRDSRSCGTGQSEQSALFKLIEKTAKALGISVGNHNGPGDHALLVDRVARRASFNFRELAQEFLARRVETAPN